MKNKIEQLEKELKNYKDFINSYERFMKIFINNSEEYSDFQHAIKLSLEAFHEDKKKFNIDQNSER